MKDLAIVVAMLDLHDAVHLCIERVVLARADIVSRMELCAALANQNVACLDGFTREALHASPLSVTVPTVFR